MIRVGEIDPLEAPSSHELMKFAEDLEQAAFRTEVLEELGRYLG